MKYQIDQIVFTIQSRAGKIEIGQLLIDHISKSKISGLIFYAGNMVNDPENIPNTLEESLCFPSQEDAIQEILKQVEELKG